MRMWQILLLIIVIVPTLLLAGAILLNRVPLTEPPGFMARISTYLGHNVARLEPNSAFPELQPVMRPVKPALLCAEIPPALDAMGWSWQRNGDCSFKATVTTPLLGFTDDVTIHVDSVGEASSRLVVRSASRIGKGDLGANTRHILDLIDAVDRQMAEGKPVTTGTD